MQRHITVFGLLAGLVIITINTLSYELGAGYEWLGFLVMFIAFGAIFFAIKQYRDTQLGGVIRFSTALGLGLGISIVATLIYVAGWEIYLAATDYAYIDIYIQSVLDAQRAAGASETELAEVIAQTNLLREQYADPITRPLMTSVEILPVGLLTTLIASLTFKNASAAK